MFCQKCGKELIEGAVFCNSCGNPVQIQGEVTNAASTVPQNNIPNKATAIKHSKPWYKRWWVWVIAAAVLFIILAAIGSCDVDSGGGVIITTVDSGASSQPKASTAPKNPYPDEILYNGVPISQIFQTKAEDISKLIGEPFDTKGFDEAYFYEPIEGSEGAQVCLSYNLEGHLNEISAYDMSNFSFNGASLGGKTRAELAEILGASNDGAGPNKVGIVYVMNWQYSNYSVEVQMEDNILLSATFTNNGGKTFVPDGDIGKRKIYDDDVFGNMAVTLEHVEFIDCILDTDGKSYLYPDDGCVFMYITVSVENIGNKSGSLMRGWNKVVFDNSYEFNESWFTDLPNTIMPLTSPVTGHIVFEVPTNVSESDKSLILNFGDGSGKNALSYVLR